MQPCNIPTVPRFASNIRFVERKEFERLPSHTLGRVTAHPAFNIGIFTGGKTTGIKVNDAGGVTNSRFVVPFHFSPEESPGENLNKLRAGIAMLRERKPDLRALLIGGQSGFDESAELGQRLEALFDKEGIPYSKFWGQRQDGQSDFAYSALDDTWTIRSARKWGEKDVTSLKRLLEGFEQIGVAEGDTVEIGGRVYSPGQIAKAKAEWDAAGSKSTLAQTLKRLLPG